jgi:hypothetical protein
MSKVGRVCEDVCALILLQLDVFHSVTIALKNTVFINQCKIVVSFPKIIIVIVITVVVVVVESSPCFLGSAFSLIKGPYSGRPLSVIHSSHLQIFNFVKPLIIFKKRKLFAVSAMNAYKGSSDINIKASKVCPMTGHEG